MKTRKQALEAVISMRQVDAKATAALDHVAELSVRGEFRAAPGLASRLHHENGPRWIGSLIEMPPEGVPVERSIAVSAEHSEAIQKFLQSRGLPALTEMDGREVALEIVLSVGTFGSVDLELRRVLEICDAGPWSRWTSDQRKLVKNSPPAPDSMTVSRSRQLQLDHAPKQIVVIAPQKGSAGRTDVERELGPDSGLPWNVSVTFEDVPFQGPGAEEQIARVIASSAQKADLVLIARGGGKRSDLWPFETAVVAEAIRAASTHHGAHVVTALGHARDQTFADAIADSSFPVPHTAAQQIKKSCWKNLERTAPTKTTSQRHARTRPARDEGAVGATAARISQLEKSLTELMRSRDQIQRTLDTVTRDHEVSQLNALASTVPTSRHVAALIEARRAVHLRWVAVMAGLLLVLCTAATFAWDVVDHFTTGLIAAGLLALLAVGAEVGSRVLRRRATRDAGVDGLADA